MKKRKKKRKGGGPLSLRAKGIGMLINARRAGHSLGPLKFNPATGKKLTDEEVKRIVYFSSSHVD
jgi:hypothetical protein